MTAHQSTTDTAMMDSNKIKLKETVQVVASKIQHGQDNVLDSEIEHLREIFDEPTILPFLDRAYLQSGSVPSDGQITLVRYRGMVQDMLDSEFYVNQVNGIQTKYRDYYGCEPMEHNVVAEHLQERQLLFLVPIPFVTSHLKRNQVPCANVASPSSHPNASGKKRSMEQATSPCHDSPARKQPVLIQNDSPTSTTPTSVVSLENNHTSRHVDTDWWPAGCMGSDPHSCPVLAKMYYKDQDTSHLKLNQVVDMIGVLSMNPLDANFDEPNDMDGMVLPPPSRLPRLHVLCYKELDLFGNVMKKTLSLLSNVAMEEDTLQDSRSLTIETLNQHVFHGHNKTAANAVLMALMSTAERQLQQGHKENMYCPIQKPDETTLGCASLLLQTSTPTASHNLIFRLQQVLQQLVPVVAVLQVNSKDKSVLQVPAKNEFGRLVPSPFQLPKGSVVLIHHENDNTPRTTPSWGALSKLIKNHVVPYTFDGGISYNFEADYSVICVSSGNHQTLDCTLSMKLDSVDVAEETPSVSTDALNRIQSYLANCRAFGTGAANNIVLSRHVLEVAQEEFIETRIQQRKQNKNQVVGEEDFHRWLTLTRLVARSRAGDLREKNDSNVAATVDDWKESLRLDEAMMTVE